ncbi:hypothetical protein Tco_0524206 [Tanacetum coccineum]
MEKLYNSSGDETLTDSTYENFKREKAYKAVPPPTGTIIPPRANVSFTGIDELAIRNKVVNQEKTNTSQSAIDRNKVIIEDWVDSDDEETDVSESQKETIFNTKHSEESFQNSTVGSQARTSQTVKKSAMISPKQTWKPKGNYLDSVNRGNGSYTLKQFEYGNPAEDLKDYAIIDSGCSGKKETIKTSCLDFEKVSYVEELKFNLLSVSQICDKKHNVLFTDKECLILSPKFKFVDEDLVILRAPRKNDVLHNYYTLYLKIIIPLCGITLFGWTKSNMMKLSMAQKIGACQLQKYQQFGVKGNMVIVVGLPSRHQA